jgi:hypothetical protein
LWNPSVHQRNTKFKTICFLPETNKANPYIYAIQLKVGHPVEQIVEALRYKPEGGGFDSRRGYWDFVLS